MKPHFVYVVQALTYGLVDPIKIGIAADVRKRVARLPSMGISMPELLGWFEMPSKAEAERVEAAVKRRFAHRHDDRYASREVLAVPPEDIINFAAIVAGRPFKSSLSVNT